MRLRRRTGFSLMEVLMATGILLACLIVLGELAAVGRRHARDAEQLSAAQLLCRSRLSEILAGSTPLESQAAIEMPELPGWSQTVLVESLGNRGLSSVTVTVTRATPEALQTPGGGGKSFSLSRLVYLSDASLTSSGSWTERESP